MGVPFFVSLLTACLFYVIIPVGGAFWVRAQWRRFRSRVLSCSLKKRFITAISGSPGRGIWETIASSAPFRPFRETT